MKVLGRISLVLMGLVMGGLMALLALSLFPNLSPFRTEATKEDTQVINAVTRVQQVALVSLAIEGISEDRAHSELFGVEVPGSERVTFIRYSFDAKLGLDGADVVVTQTGEHSFEIEMPEFIFIGHDDVTFEVAAENNGVLSWVTSDIDELGVVNDVLDEDAQGEYLAKNQELLREQAEKFYTSLVLSVDPEAEITYVFPTPTEGLNTP